MQRKLYRDTANKKIAGVCSGLADYLNIDPTIVRLIWAALFLAYGAGLFVYLIAWAIVPEKVG